MIVARCKFTVDRVVHYPGDHSRDIVLSTRYDEALSKEDRAFSKATPNGKLEITLSNPNVYELFTPGNVVYLDVTLVE